MTSDPRIKLRGRRVSKGFKAKRAKSFQAKIREFEKVEMSKRGSVNLENFEMSIVKKSKI